MSNGPKPKVAFFDFTCCEGCQLTVIDSLQTHPELLEAVDIVEFREAMSEKSDRYYIAFVEGSCVRESDEKRLRDIRERAAIVVALGACAHLGGVNAIRSLHDLEEARQYVYGDKGHWFENYDVKAISQVIDVDAVIPGCPIDRDEFIQVVRTLLQGRDPKLPTYPVCIECKLHENVCIYDRGGVCLGPITRAGCQAICPSYGVGCDGCRGLIPFPKINSLKNVLAERGLSDEEINDKLAIFLTNQIAQFEEMEDSYVS
ncbi:MAG: NADH:ubiquinone oxidoreductase [Candidatus Promineifilaceae bacterium]